MTLDDLATHHRKQAEHFAPFGAANALTRFHAEASALCASAAKDENVRKATALMQEAKGYSGIERDALESLAARFAHAP